MNTKDLKDLKDLQRRAEQGEASAQFELGKMYYDGEGVPRNYETAADWFLKAANRGFAEAEFCLGKMCIEGKVQKRNPDPDYVKDKGMSWLRESADKGHVGARLYLGKIYSEGKVEERDIKEAYKWYKMAAAQGNEEAIKKLDELEKEMTPEEIAEAQRGPFPK